MDLAQTLKGARLALRLSQQDVADRLKVSKPAVSKWEKGSTAPERRRLPELARVLGLRLDELREMADQYEAAGQAQLPGFEPPARISSPSARMGTPPDMPPPGPVPPMPVYASAQGGADGAWILSSDPVAWMQRDSRLVGVIDAFACYVEGDSMVNAYERGNLLLVNPSATAAAGDDCLLVREAEDGARYALVKRLVKISESSWTVKQFNPEKTYSLPRRDWQHAMLVIGKYNRAA